MNNESFFSDFNKSITVPYWLITVISVAFVFGAGTLISINNQISEIKSDVKLINYQVLRSEEVINKVESNEKAILIMKNRLDIIEKYFDLVKKTSSNNTNKKKNEIIEKMTTNKEEYQYD